MHLNWLKGKNELKVTHSRYKRMHQLTDMFQEHVWHTPQLRGHAMRPITVNVQLKLDPRLNFGGEVVHLNVVPLHAARGTKCALNPIITIGNLE